MKKCKLTHLFPSFEPIHCSLSLPLSLSLSLSLFHSPCLLNPDAVLHKHLFSLWHFFLNIFWWNTFGMLFRLFFFCWSFLAEHTRSLHVRVLTQSPLRMGGVPACVVVPLGVPRGMPKHDPRRLLAELGRWWRVLGRRQVFIGGPVGSFFFLHFRREGYHEDYRVVSLKVSSGLSSSGHNGRDDFVNGGNQVRLGKPSLCVLHQVNWEREREESLGGKFKVISLMALSYVSPQR